MGQFANGDWWVVGPVTITQIDPASIPAGGRTMHGSMVNPDAGIRQHGYDSPLFRPYRMDANGQPYYQASLNVALGVASGQALTLQPGNSLVTTAP